MPLQATSGAASYDAFGGGVAVVPTYIEDVFSCFLYTGNGSAQTITNGIDLAGKGGLVWIKSRSVDSNHALFDTVRGTNKYLRSNATDSQTTASPANSLTAFNTNGFSLGADTGTEIVNYVDRTYVSWTIRKQPKFFDIQTWTGNGTAGREISHALGSVPGCIIIKATSGSYVRGWAVWHRGINPNSTNKMVYLNTTAAQTTEALFNDTLPTSTVFTLSGDGFVNGPDIGTPTTYIAYIFAHDAGGFGLTGTDNVISCGSFNYNTDPQTVTIGYEPQWLMVKRSDGVGDWIMFDNMRGFTANAGGGAGKRLLANTSGAETANDGLYYGGATGFNLNLPAYGNYIYIAIRRGPMKVPTTGTSVFTPIARTGTGAVAQITGVGFPPDLSINAARTRSASANTQVTDRLRGTSVSVFTNRTDGDLTYTNAITAFGSDGETLGTDATQGAVNVSGSTYINWLFGRAPGFFDEVCYTGTGVDPQTVSHNLGKAPELMIFKARGVAAGWRVWGGNMAITEYLALSETSAVVTGSTFFGSTTPTATSFYVGSGLSVSGRTHVAYLFATAAGVSKVFSYTGNGSSQTINCGFTGGARFVLIKRTDSTGDWYVWDTARGIVAGNDPHLSLNTTSAEVTTDDTIDTDNTGFVVNQVSATNVNVSSATYIGLAVA